MENRNWEWIKKISIFNFTQYIEKKIGDPGEEVTVVCGMVASSFR
jgi:hypothetical protein